MLKKSSLLQDIEPKFTKLKHCSKKDGLTGAICTSNFKQKLGMSLALTKFNQQLALLYLDIEKLGEINQAHGREKGDTVLSTLASNPLKALRENNITARVGNDEFCILAKVGTGKSSIPDVESLISRIQAVEAACTNHTWTPVRLAIGIYKTASNQITPSGYIDNPMGACSAAKEKT